MEFCLCQIGKNEHLFNSHVQQKGKFRYIIHHYIADAYTVICSFPSMISVCRVRLLDD